MYFLFHVVCVCVICMYMGVVCSPEVDVQAPSQAGHQICVFETESHWLTRLAVFTSVVLALYTCVTMPPGDGAQILSCIASFFTTWTISPAQIPERERNKTPKSSNRNQATPKETISTNCHSDENTALLGKEGDILKGLHQVLLRVREGCCTSSLLAGSPVYCPQVRTRALMILRDHEDGQPEHISF